MGLSGLRATAGRRLAGLTVEGLRLFFPLAALHAALWPFLWVVVQSYALPAEAAMPAHLWHGQEMIFGAYGAALAGFLLSALPEWTDTPRLAGRPLLLLALPWAVARGIGLIGAQPLLPVAAAADLLLLGWLASYATHLAWQRPAGKLRAFAFWLWALAAAAGATRLGFARQDPVLAAAALRAGLLVFLVLLALAMARILPTVLNLALDPTRASTPFRPHPGRRHLAAGMAALALAGQVAGLSPAVQGFLLLGAGAAFLDRIGDAFIGRGFFRAEVLALAGAAALSGIGLGAMGLDRLGMVGLDLAGLHMTGMGGLGLALLGVFAVAGLLHTGQDLRVPALARLAFLLVVAAAALRAAAVLGLDPMLAHGAASLVWAVAFLVWLAAYLPAFLDPGQVPHDRCG
jgi:uncharacterized protein involved in response to NO